MTPDSMNLRTLIWILFLLAPSGLAAQQREEITNYHSEIRVNQDGSLDVTETITVLALQQDIQRGIFRSFPVIYRDRYNNRVRVGFEVTEVLKDGAPEPYEVITQGDFQVIRIGNPDVILSSGSYTYTITYSTNRQIGYFDEFDELYWNVIGDDWSFPIAKASASIQLPEGAGIIQYAGYSGPTGSDSCDCLLEKTAENRLSVTLTKPLNPREALTIAVAWPKGIIDEPTQTERNIAFLGDNAGFLITLIGTFIVFAYYFFVWKKVGVDPKRGGIYPIFEIPENLEAAAIRYIYKMGFDQTTFTVSIVQLATKGVIKIAEEKKKFYLHLTKTGEDAHLDTHEKAIVQALFPGDSTVIHLTQKEHKRIGGALKAVQQYLKVNYGGKYFKLNQGWLVPGVLLSIATILSAFAVIFPMRFEEERLFLIMGSVLTLFISGFLSHISVQLYNVILGEGVKVGVIVKNVFLIVVVLAIPGFLIYQFEVKFEYGLLIVFMVLAFVNFLFFQLIKAPTPEGRKIMDEIEGFRLYLNAAEKPMIQALNPPGLTPQIFEKYLPYAIALGVGKAWGDSFEKALKTFEQTAGRRSHYHPLWYSGTALKAGTIAGLTQGLGKSFGSALTNSSAPPGSSSGSGGGGRSGGGGGGGGGGGW